MPEEIKNIVLGLVTGGNSSLAKNYKGLPKSTLEIMVRAIVQSHNYCIGDKSIAWLAHRIHYLANLETTAPKAINALKKDKDVVKSVKRMLTHTTLADGSLQTLVVSKEEQENLQDLIKCVKTKDEGVQLLLIVSK